MTSRSWCWTFFASIDINVDEIKAGLEGIRNHRYSMFQLESCPDTERLHYQGYSEFSNSVRMACLRGIMPGVHCERRRGSREDAKRYCCKDDSRVDVSVIILATLTCLGTLVYRRVD